MATVDNPGTGMAGTTDDRSAMLRDIAAEVAYTRREIGKDALDARVMAALAKVPRELFIPESNRYRAFANGAVPIGHGQTISQPYIVALMTDLVGAQADDRVLEIGTGCGYQTAVLAELVRQVYSIEIIAALAEAAAQRLALLGYGNATVRHADGYHGWPEQAPFDGIVVTAAAPHVPPPLVAQLKPGARMVIPVGSPGGVQELTVVEKAVDGSTRSRSVLLVAFVPLTRSPA